MQPTLSRPPKTMLAYAILDESEELVLMTIEALIQLAAGNAGVNVANVGIASFAILTAIRTPSPIHDGQKCLFPILGSIKQLMRNRLMQNSVTSSLKSDA